MKPYDNLLDQLIARRHELQLSQSAMDYKVGCADGLVGKWERQKRIPSGFMLSCWVDALDCELQIKQR